MGTTVLRYSTERCPVTRGHTPINVEIDDDGVTHYTWTTHKHWLGESLIRGTIVVHRQSPCRMCNGTGEDRDMHGPVHPDDFRRREPWPFWCAKCHGSGVRRWTQRRTSYFLSGFDHNETRPVYFFCELPQGSEPTTLDEAYEVLKPETVKLAEDMGRPVTRQGDIFAVPVTLTKRELRKQGARFEKRGRLLGTNHEATEVAYLDKLTLARGVLWHNPEWRGPDHRRVRLHDGWNVIVKNTVPIAVGASR